MPLEDLPAWAFARAAEIGAAASFADLEESTREAAIGLGLKEYFLIEASETGAAIVVGRTDTPLFQTRYVSGATPIRDDDLIHRLSRTTVEPFFYSDVLVEEAMSERDRANTAARRAAGILDGFVGARHRTREDVSTCTVFVTDHVIPMEPALRLAITLVADQYGAAARRLRAAPAPAVPKLTQRQIDCLQWAARGKSGADIADILGLSAHTVHAHVADACARLGVRTRVQAVAAAVALGLIST